MFNPYEQVHVAYTAQRTGSVELVFERVVERSRQYRSDCIKKLLIRLGVLAVSPMVRFGLYFVGRLYGRA
jgi:hypothetical protein